MRPGGVVDNSILSIDNRATWPAQYLVHSSREFFKANAMFLEDYRVAKKGNTVKRLNLDSFFLYICIGCPPSPPPLNCWRSVYNWYAKTMTVNDFFICG